MYRLFSLTALGLTTAGLTLATPSTSQAQTPFGISIDWGNGSFGYSQGFRYGLPGSCGPSYGPSYYSPSIYSPGYGYDSCDRGIYRRPAIVHPEYNHWTPGRGLHSHGHIHSPTPFGYRTYRY